jgi:lysophospholipase L1-like esterase
MMTTRFYFFILLAFILSCESPQQQKITLYLIGDSTMAEKEPDKRPETGWGEMIPEFFNENLIVKNHAVNGRSSKSFIDEGRWDNVLDSLRPGDYVCIQFGHNDQKEYDPERYTIPITGYRQNLIRFITETRAKGACPLLATPIVRRKFNEEGTLVDTHGLYAGDGLASRSV